MASCHAESQHKGGNIMAMLTMVKAIEQIHPKDVVLFKIGSFYHAYSKDSYILSYLFEYKIK